VVHEQWKQFDRAVTTAGVVTNFSGAGIAAPAGITVGPDSALWFTNTGNNSIGRITTAGVVANFLRFRHREPERDRGRARRCGLVHQRQRLRFDRRITTAGVVTHFGSAMYYPKQIVVGPDKALWFTTPNGRVWRITTRGVLSYFSGSDNSYGIAEGPPGRCGSPATPSAG